MQATSASFIFWTLTVMVVWFIGGKWSRLKNFRERMLGQWKAALGITLVYALSVVVYSMSASGAGLALIGGTMTFCQALIGLALARGIAGYESLPVVRTIAGRQRIARSLALMVGFALLAVVAALMASALGTGIARVLGEIKQSSHAEQSFMPALWQLFFMFLAGAGIAEETVYRLVIVSLVWGFTDRRGLAIIVSGLLFGAYHLTPLDGMYLTFWQYPLTQFFSSALMGMVWAYFYVRRGYETVVLAHTLSDWLPVAVFIWFMK